MTEIFVFGSNLAGIHGAGAARTALDEKNAIFGIGVGLQGNSYAIPTKDWNVRTLPYDTIKLYVDQFKQYAKMHPEMSFYVTKIGCGYADIKTITWHHCLSAVEIIVHLKIHGLNISVLTILITSLRNKFS